MVQLVKNENWFLIRRPGSFSYYVERRMSFYVITRLTLVTTQNRKEGRALTYALLLSFNDHRHVIEKSQVRTAEHVKVSVLAVHLVTDSNAVIMFVLEERNCVLGLAEFDQDYIV